MFLFQTLTKCASQGSREILALHAHCPKNVLNLCMKTKSVTVGGVATDIFLVSQPDVQLYNVHLYKKRTYCIPDCVVCT